MTTARPIQILLVEDNPADIRLTVEALKDARVHNHVSVASDGDEALAILRREGDHAGAPLPDIILMDLNMPRKDGREFLAEVKRDEALKHLPVIVLTTSDLDEDVLVSYDVCANAYIKKPVDQDRFMEVVRTLGDFWFEIVRLPRGLAA
jgi:CheY-like chemotaxis protein